MIQHKPVVNNLQASLQKLESLLQAASQSGAQIAAFGETWLCGYPAWLDYCPNIGNWDAPATKAAFRNMYENSLMIPSKEFTALREIVARAGMYVVVGINEALEGRGTLYNTILILGPDGELLNHHRKLMPTFTEKLLYGLGDGAGLKSIPTPYGLLSASICWEHWMPHVRQALHNQGEHLHLALWPMMQERHLLASRHYAFEGRCYVAALGQMQDTGDFPPDLELPASWQKGGPYPVLRGGSAFIGPDGELIEKPVYDQEDILYVEFDANTLLEERMTLDVSGHYQRPDIFTFTVDETRK